jgi:ABC-type maltose transport system permease subunit
MSFLLALPWWEILWNALKVALGGMAIYFMWSWGRSITQGVQQASPYLGALVGSMGALLSMLPIMMMFMMFMNMFSSFMGMFRD